MIDTICSMTSIKLFNQNGHSIILEPSKAQQSSVLKAKMELGSDQDVALHDASDKVLDLLPLAWHKKHREHLFDTHRELFYELLNLVHFLDIPSLELSLVKQLARRCARLSHDQWELQLVPLVCAKRKMYS